jgi:uncharacterized protein YbjT (DUF2867 family)
MNVLIAGTGILGRNLIELYLARGDTVRALAYSPRGFQGLPVLSNVEGEHPKLSTAVCDVTRPDTLTGICDGIDAVISCIGITRMKGDLTHMDVDYRGNVNLLREAEHAGVRKFGLISPAGVDEGKNAVPLLKAKHLFENELKRSSIDWLIFRSGGFFNDLKQMGNMARKGSMFVIGHGRNHFTPIDVRDLAEIMVEDLDRCSNRIIDAGGPEDMSWNEICRTCFEHYGKKPLILKFPKWLCGLFVSMMRPVSRSSHAMGKLMVFMSTIDLPTDKRGRRRFANYLSESD